jgi:pimeloyl-ACP methyl ester carboxylesterase
MSITTVGSNLIHYEAVGRGQPLIFIHGWLGSWRYWWPSMQGLSAHYRTFALDLWGFGDSSKATDMYSLSNYVSLLDSFIDRLGVAVPVALIGHSLGAAVAVRYAAERPEHVSRVATVSLPITGRHLNAPLAQSDTAALAERVFARTEKHPEVEGEMRKTDPAALSSLAGEFSQANFIADLSQIQCPLLLVFGNHDPIVEQPNGDLEGFIQPAGNRAYVTFDACSHFPMLEEKAKFNRLILEFLRSEENVANLAPKDYWQRRTY